MHIEVSNSDDDELAPNEAANLDASDNDADQQEEEARALLKKLREEHRRIDQEITALQETGVTDMLKIRRMKKIKLSMRDQIQYLENQLTPDIIA